MVLVLCHGRTGWNTYRLTLFVGERWVGEYAIHGVRVSQIYGVSQPPTKASSSGMHTEAYYPTWDRSERQSSADGLKGDEDGY